MNNLLENQRHSRELRFAIKIRQLLDESAEAIPGDRLEKLAAARKAALRVQRPTKRPAMQLASRPVLAGVGLPSIDHDHSGSFGRIGLVFGMLLLVIVCLFGLFQVEQDRHTEELADIDSALLTDELPISTYADHGFNAYLKQNP